MSTQNLEQIRFGFEWTRGLVHAPSPSMKRICSWQLQWDVSILKVKQNTPAVYGTTRKIESYFKCPKHAQSCQNQCLITHTLNKSWGILPQKMLHNSFFELSYSCVIYFPRHLPLSVRSSQATSSHAAIREHRSELWWGWCVNV